MLKIESLAQMVTSWQIGKDFVPHMASPVSEQDNSLARSGLIALLGGYLLKIAFSYSHHKVFPRS